MLPWVIDVARAVRTNILTNLMWAFGYNIVALSLAALGLLQPILAAAVMAGSSILVVVNSLRLERLPDPVSSPIPARPSGVKSARGGIGVPVVLGPAIEQRLNGASSTEYVVGECGVPAVRLARRLAPRLGAFAHLTEKDVGDLDRPASGFEADGVAHRVVGG